MIKLQLIVEYKSEVKTGNGLRIEGVLGCCASGNVRNACVSDTEMGIGGTCQWKFCSLTSRSTLCVQFEISAQHGSAIPQGARGMVQFVTQYQHADGRKRIRVTTTCRSWADMATQQPNIAYGFDQVSTVLSSGKTTYKFNDGYRTSSPTEHFAIEFTFRRNLWALMTILSH
ncbi:unnamed protein product [Cylicostephanus goldi]|uniref:Protein transport protein SEC23 n=1 Tax=Cylicostephanus goldi TaxID=71465 RepID=A0A3P7MWX2_CYLGO|nr:unnamed protein product [Cylicostephanus goldi]